MRRHKKGQIVMQKAEKTTKSGRKSAPKHIYKST